MLHDKPGLPSPPASPPASPSAAVGPPAPPEPARGGARDAALDLGCLLLLLTSALSCAWIADDAFISLRVVENAADGFGLRWNTDERVLVFSHPLWLLLHLPLAAAGLPSPAVNLGLSLLSVASMGLLLLRGLPRPLGRATLLALASLKTVIDHSASGLENPLLHVIVAAIALQALGPTGGSGVARGRRVAALVGLLLLTRPDQLGLAFGALLWALLQSKTPRHWAQAAAWALGPAALWALGALAWTGSPVPNPTLAKLGAGVPQAVLIKQGLGYLLSCAAADPLAAVLLTLGLGLGLGLGFRGFAGAAGRLLAVGGLLQLAVVVLEGGDFMVGRFLSPTLVLAVLLLAHAGLRWPRMAAGALISTALLGAAHPRGPTAGPTFDHRGLDARGVADERGFYFQTTGWWPRLRDRRPLPTPAPPGPPQVTTMMNVGLDGFLAGPSVHIIDPMALTDPLLARLPADCGGPCRPGHLQRAVPEAHLAALARGAPGDQGAAALGALQQDVWWMTRGALFSAERWRVILRRRGR